MNTIFIDKEILYDGAQLCSHWVLKQTGLYGDAIASFIGPCDVSLDKMVDLEDIIQKKPIYSELMLHFIVEQFHLDLTLAICHQRLLISLIQEEFLDATEGKKIIRRGDDLFDEHCKLTVSIATKSPVSCLIHTGINILSRNTPVPTLGLVDYNLNPQAFARSVMNRFVEELNTMAKARAKVRGVL